MKYIPQAWRIGRLLRILRGKDGAVWRPLLFGIPILISALVLIGAGAFTPSVKSPDTDNDGMTDAFEQFYWLDYLDSGDALMDYDGDHLLNAREGVLGIDPFSSDTDFDGFQDDTDAAISRFYIQWGSPWFTDGDNYDYARPDYILGAWKDGGSWFSTFATPESGLARGSRPLGGEGGRVVRTPTELSTQSGWHAASVESNIIESLNVALDRTILTNDLIYAVHYWSDARASLFVDLLDAFGGIVVEDLYGNLMGGTNAEAVVLLDIPTGTFTNAAVIRLRRGMPVVSGVEPACGELVEPAEVVIYEGLIYIDCDFDGLDADQEKQLGTSDYRVDSNGDGVSDYEACFHTTNTSTNIHVPIVPDIDDGGDEDNVAKGIIYVDQVLGNDTFTGRASAISGMQTGPKKTIHEGMAAVDADGAHTMVIKPGAYNENLNLHGRNVKVVIEGNVKL